MSSETKIQLEDIDLEDINIKELGYDDNSIDEIIRISPSDMLDDVDDNRHDDR